MYRAISLGWGVQSWTLAAMSALGELPPVEAAIHADTGHEMEATYAFAAQWTPWLEARGVKVVITHGQGNRGTNVIVTNTETNAVMIPAFAAIQGKNIGATTRQCTGHWKIAPIRRYLQANRNGEPVELWLGITKDEIQRAKDSDVRYITHHYPLLDMGFSRADCLRWLAEHDLPSPGKSSCTFCPYHNRKAWETIKRAGGADWEEAVAVDAAIRDARAPIELYLHASGKPLAEAVVIPEDFGYSQLDLLASDDADAECDSGHCFL